MYRLNHLELLSPSFLQEMAKVMVMNMGSNPLPYLSVLLNTCSPAQAAHIGVCGRLSPLNSFPSSAGVYTWYNDPETQISHRMHQNHGLVYGGAYALKVWICELNLQETYIFQNLLDDSQ